MTLYWLKLKGKSSIVRNKANAVRLAKANPGCEVWARPDVPEISAWDWPTFVQGAHRVYPILAGDILADAYRQAALADLVAMPDVPALRRAGFAYARNCREPGDCDGDHTLLLALAIAEAHVGQCAGWIPEMQRIAVEIAKILA